MNKVLVLDDDQQIVEALGIILRTAGYEVVCKTDPDNIESIVESTQPDIIILDIRLTHSSGFEVTRILRDNPATTDIPIILISARVGNISGDELQGADLYLPKPFRMHELLEAIQKLLVAHSST